MAAVSQPLSRSPFEGDQRAFANGGSVKSIPILPSAAAHTMNSNDTMDVSRPAPPPATMGPPAANSVSTERPQPEQPSQAPSESKSAVNGNATQSVGAAAAAQQPKVVQTAFIHKLYNMLEDSGIQHLISWSNTNDSFVMSPSSEFSKVLAQYFKHTNISSFVRQLNMYGFHKVSDVFHTGSPDSPLWEFKHGAGNFKRGDLAGLREIKRRASRHALIHRDSFSAGIPKLTPQPPAGMPMEQMQDPVEARLNMLEWNHQDLYAKLSRTDEKYQAVLDGLTKCNHWSHELSTHLLSLVPDPDNPIHRDVFAMRQEVARQIDQLRNLDEPHDQGFGAKQSFLQNSNAPMEPNIPVSPRQRPFDDSRRPSLQTTGRPNSFRAPVPPHLQVSPRRYGSIGSGSGAYSPTSSRLAYPPPPPPPQPAQPHPLSNMSSPPANLARRHTSADIRVHGWQHGQGPPQYNSNNQGSSPYASGHSSSAWPSSPHVTANPGDQQIRDSLAQYELPRASLMGSKQPSPPPPPPHESAPPSFTNSFSSYANTNDAGWQIPGVRSAFKGLEASGPPTRRSSMASNVHSLLNPADTAEREDEDDGPDERKRKRLQ